MNNFGIGEGEVFKTSSDDLYNGYKIGVGNIFVRLITCYPRMGYIKLASNFMLERTQSKK